jgi:3-polyprenyl-4-hydroxybenzoate decarboxylase
MNAGSKLGIDATTKLPGEGFKRPWPPLIKMDAAVKAKVACQFPVQRPDKFLTNS